FFFFQAEDGIRDFHVTGVQTCALPICSTGVLLATEGTLSSGGTVSTGAPEGVGATVAAWPSAAPGAGCITSPSSPWGGNRGGARSEERRVGKEGRSRWSPDQWKKNDYK